MKKFILGSVAVLSLAAAVPLVASAAPDRHRGPDMRGAGMHGGHHGHHGMKRLMKLIDAYDADGDGAVTQAEIDEGRATRLTKFDADGDGQLSLAEYEQLWLDAMRERMVDAFQRHDDDGDGQVTAEEFGERTQRMVMMRDRNEDGKLDLEDLRRGKRGGDKPAEQ